MTLTKFIQDSRKDEQMTIQCIKLERFVEGNYYEWGTYGITQSEIESLAKAITNFANFKTPVRVTLVEKPVDESQMKRR